MLCFDSEEQASKAVEALEDYVAGQITANEDYRPAEIPKLENALVKQLQHTVLLLVANDYEAAAIDAYHSKSWKKHRVQSGPGVFYFWQKAQGSSTVTVYFSNRAMG